MSYFIIYWKKKQHRYMWFFARTDIVVYPFKLHLTMVLNMMKKSKWTLITMNVSVHHIYFQVQNHADNKS